MTVIYENKYILIKKKNQKEYSFFFKKWDSDARKFWVNFPFSLMKIISENNNVEKNTKEYILRADKMMMFPAYLKKNKKMSYNSAMALLYDVGNQLQSLEMFNMGLPFLNLEDILVVDDKHFFIINTTRILTIKNKNIKIETPYKKSFFYSPEIQNNKSIPAKINWKSSYYSLASIVVYCLTGEYVLGNKKSSGEILNVLYQTKLFWALERCLEEDVNKRYYLII